MSEIFPLICGAQSYDWGKLGDSSAVARFAKNADKTFAIDESKPYAELWMGTHPSVPSKNAETGETLRDFVTKQPAALGDKVAAKFGTGELPYLFKVLSIRKALSIQAHPSKELGAVLHARDPKNYPDPNHKPEMAIAVTAFEGFCGFRPLGEISTFLKTVPEFTELVGGAAEAEKFEKAVAGQETAEEDSEQDKANREALRALFSNLMHASAEKVEDAARRLVARAEKEGASFGGSAGGEELSKLVVRLNKQFPNDIGLFCGCMLLNYVTLTPGEAMFLKAKDPHAYISGDIIECMAASDNVVRAGFTPKFKDVDTLVDMLTYSYAPVMEQKMKPLEYKQASGEGCQFILYDPPIAEFAVLETRISSSTAKYEAVDGPSIFIVTEGDCEVSGEGSTTKIVEGGVFFVGANTPISVKTDSKNFVSYRAFCVV